MITVSDASPLIFLAKIGCFNLIKTLFQEVSVPQQVYIDVAVKGKNKPGAKEVNKALKDTWIKVIETKEKAKVEKLKEDWKIHQGETEAIVLAQSLSASQLLADDDKAVSKARDLKITVIRTPGILLLAKRRGLIPKIKKEIDHLLEEGYWMTSKEYENLLKEVNEF